ncbi:MAG: hypothetical protein U1E62_14895 [Alsobacter sp.]
MTIRRDVMKTAAALARAAAPPSPRPQETAADGLRPEDESLAYGIEVARFLLDDMKAHLLAANHADMQVRHAHLYDMRHALASLGHLIELVMDEALAQREAMQAELRRPFGGAEAE